MVWIITRQQLHGSILTTVWRCVIADYRLIFYDCICVYYGMLDCEFNKVFRKLTATLILGASNNAASVSATAASDWQIVLTTLVFAGFIFLLERLFLWPQRVMCCFLGEMSHRYWDCLKWVHEWDIQWRRQDCGSGGPRWKKIWGPIDCRLWVFLAQFLIPVI